MLDYQTKAINNVREYAKSKSADDFAYVTQICEPFHIEIETLIKNVLKNSVTLNFHPDRFSNNGKTILENLLEEGKYHGQFRTGITNGGGTAYIGGDRYLWEQRIFNNAYPQDSIERPKYGALNIFRYLDGASVRFGSCFFTLKPEVINRCTFAYGDSSTNPTTLSTCDTFTGVLSGLFKDLQENKRVLNEVISSEQETLAVLLNSDFKLKNIGRNLDYCIETHIHGDILLSEDVECFYIDSSFAETSFEKQAKALCEKYGLILRLIPERRLAVENIGDLFRGPKIPILAKKIDSVFDTCGYINAELIGRTARDSTLSPEDWQDIGNQQEIFQYLKQLWHTVAYFG